MTPRLAFNLKVWHQEEDEFCSFLLLWDGGSKDIYVSLKYSKELQKRYQRWQQCYFRFYEFLPAQPLGHSGSIKYISGDPCHDLRQAEQDLVKAFQRWLGEGEVRKIQETIRDELTRIAQNSSVGRKGTRNQAGVDIFLSCNTIELARLPWEAWEIMSENAPPGTIRIARTFGNGATISSRKRPLRRKHSRILAIVGSDPELPLHEDWKTIRSSLKSIADVRRVTWQPEDNQVEIKNKVAADISDEQGWDVLFFAGHSDETATGGRLAIAPNVSLSISELEDCLIEARDNGLQLAVFNSCSGLPIAHKLVEMGMQVVVMREPIHHKVAQVFLKQFCQQLAEYNDAHGAWQHACRHLESVGEFAYPSAYLIPSFFSPANTTPFRIEPLGLKRLQQWLPTPQEAIALSSVLILSVMYPVQDLLLEVRVLVQALYQDKTSQLERSVSPPVLLIAVDQESINRADAEIDGFQTMPMDREYLARLVTRVSDFKAKVIGIDYVLNAQEPRKEKLAKSLQSAVNRQGVWFVFAVSEPDQWKVSNKIASSNWSLQGDITFFAWDVALPKDATCTKLCPFAYLLALAHTLNEKSSLASLPQPNLQSRADFQQEVTRYLKQGKEQENAIASMKSARPPFELRSIIDFSIPPNQAYERIPAWKFLTLPFPNPELQKKIKQQVVIVAPGGYTDAEDNFPVPLAVNYWCHSLHGREHQKADCPQVFTGGETHAYMIHHLLSSHRVTLIPDFWLVGIAAIFGKWTTLILLKQKHKQRQQRALMLVGATTAYGIVGLQVYTTASVSIPWFLPVVLFWTYVLLVLRKKS